MRDPDSRTESTTSDPSLMIAWLTWLIGQKGGSSGKLPGWWWGRGRGAGGFGQLPRAEGDVGKEFDTQAWLLGREMS